MFQLFQIYANSELMLERSQSFIAKNTVHVRKVSNAIEEVGKLFKRFEFLYVKVD